MASIDRFLRQVSAITNKAYVREAITTPADEKRFSIAESHFALMIEADREGASQAWKDARWNYFWTLKHFADGMTSSPNIVNLVDEFAERVARIGQQPNNLLNLPNVASPQAHPAPTH